MSFAEKLLEHLDSEIPKNLGRARREMELEISNSRTVENIRVELLRQIANNRALAGDGDFHEQFAKLCEYRVSNTHPGFSRELDFICECILEIFPVATPEAEVEEAPTPVEDTRKEYEPCDLSKFGG